MATQTFDESVMGAGSIDELFDNLRKHKPTVTAQTVPGSQSIDRLLAELLQFNSPNMGNLLGQAETLRQELRSAVDEAQSAKLEELEVKHEAAIEAQRKAQQDVAKAEAASFKALEERTRLENVAGELGDKCRAIADAWRDADKALLKRAEKEDFERRIERTNKLAEKALWDHSMAVTAYRESVFAEKAVKDAYNESVGVVKDIASQIQRLQK